MAFISVSLFTALDKGGPASLGRIDARFQVINRQGKAAQGEGSHWCLLKIKDCTGYMNMPKNSELPIPKPLMFASSSGDVNLTQLIEYFSRAAAS